MGGITKFTFCIVRFKNFCAFGADSMLDMLSSIFPRTFGAAQSSSSNIKLWSKSLHLYPNLAYITYLSFSCSLHDVMNLIMMTPCYIIKGAATVYTNTRSCPPGLPKCVFPEQASQEASLTPPRRREYTGECIKR